MLNRTPSIPQLSNRLNSRRFRSHIPPSGRCNINLTLTHAHQASRITLILKIHPQAPAQHPTHINLTSILHISNAQRPNRTTPSIHPSSESTKSPMSRAHIFIHTPREDLVLLTSCVLRLACILHLAAYNLQLTSCHLTKDRERDALMRKLTVSRI